MVSTESIRKGWRSVECPQQPTDLSGVKSLPPFYKTSNISIPWTILTLSTPLKRKAEPEHQHQHRQQSVANRQQSVRFSP